MSQGGNYESYHNRFRTSTSGDDNAAQDGGRHNLPSLSESVDMFGHSHNFGQLGYIHSDNAEQRGVLSRLTSLEGAGAPVNPSQGSSALPNDGRRLSAAHTQSQDQPTVLSNEGAIPGSDGTQPLPPTAPGKPRRLSRETNVDSKRQHFASSKHNTTSADSGCDDVFVEVGDGLYDAISGRPLRGSCLQPGKRTAEPTFSTSSTASILPNPYNRFNHRLHSLVWCCSCIYFVFFCCLPAIHYMEHSDTEYNKGNHRRAQTQARASTFLFFTGTLIMLSMFALIFFFAIFFTVYT